MKPSTQDRTEGKLHEVKGKIKEQVGKATNDPNLEVSRERGKESWQGSKMDRPCGKGRRRIRDTSTPPVKATGGYDVTNCSGKNG